MSEVRRIYLDHAATGWPKSEAVYRAVESQMRDRGAAAGRGAYTEALRSNAVISESRQLAARLFTPPARPAAGGGPVRGGAREAGDSFVLTANGTAALNLAIHGLLRPGDHVVTTAAEHNSVLRPLEWWRSNRGVTIETVPCDQHGRVRSEDVLGRVTAKTRLVAVVHASNVTGAIQPIAEIAEGLGQQSESRPPGSRPMMLCDAAQTAGVLPINLKTLRVDLLAMPGHKGLGGPLGTGLLYVGPRAAAEIEPSIQGGTGSESDQLEMPAELPGRLESGNLNVPALAGLAEGMRAVAAADLHAVAERLRERTGDLVQRLGRLPGVRAISGGELPIVSLVFDAIDCREAAAILDSEFGIEVRAGLHCAPLVHRYLGSEPTGTLRISFSSSTGDDELDAVVDAVGELARMF